MDLELERRLKHLPSLKIARPKTHRCKICGELAVEFDAVDYNRCAEENAYPYGLAGIEVPYFRCPQCEFLFTPYFDEWTSEDFARFIYNEEYFILDGDYVGVRPTANANFVASMLGNRHDCRVLDYGSGSGVLQQKLGELGYHRVECYDPFTVPERPSGLFDFIVAFEVLEHTVNPVELFAEARSLLSTGGVLLVTQHLQPPDISHQRCAWRNIGPRQGHISTFSMKTLEEIRRKFNFKYFRTLPWMHFFCDNPLSEFVRHLQKSLEAAPLGDPLVVSLERLPSQDEQWHPIEIGDRIAFRWSRSREIRWSNVYAPNRQVEIRLPISMEIRNGYAAQARFVVDGRPIKTDLVEGSISASMTNSSFEPFHSIVLDLPDPLSPLELGEAADDRKLGIAVPCSVS